MRPPDTMFVLFCFPYKRQPPGQSEDYIPLTAHVNMARHALLTSSAASQDQGGLPPCSYGHQARGSAHGGSPSAPCAVGSAVGALTGRLVTNPPVCPQPLSLSPPVLPKFGLAAGRSRAPVPWALGGLAAAWAVTSAPPPQPGPRLPAPPGSPARQVGAVTRRYLPRLCGSDGPGDQGQGRWRWSWSSSGSPPLRAPCSLRS